MNKKEENNVSHLMNCLLCKNKIFVTLIDGSKFCLFHLFHYNLMSFPNSELSEWWKEQIFYLENLNLENNFISIEDLNLKKENGLSLQETLDHILPEEIRNSVTELYIF